MFRHRILSVYSTRIFSNKDGDPMLANPIEQLCDRLISEVSQISSIESRIARQVLRYVETERNTFPETMASQYVGP